MIAISLFFALEFSSFSVSIKLGLNTISPSCFKPLYLIKSIIDSAVSDFPLPDSPIIPKISFGMTLNDKSRIK